MSYRRTVCELGLQSRHIQLDRRPILKHCIAYVEAEPRVAVGVKQQGSRGAQIASNVREKSHGGSEDVE